MRKNVLHYDYTNTFDSLALQEKRDLTLSGYEGKGWYFWNEAWNIMHGPYEKEEEAKEAFSEYCDLLDRNRIM